VIGTIVISILLDRYHKFKITLLLNAALSFVSLLLSLWTLPTRNVKLFTANVALMGFAGISVAPVGVAFSVQLTYPIPEAMSAGMMNLPNILYGFVMGITTGVLCQYSPLYALGLFAVNSLIGGLAVIFVKEELRKEDQKKKTQRDS
jgi:FLVCR family feline leukemia virus subgroup C receptor-related protein